METNKINYEVSCDSCSKLFHTDDPDEKICSECWVTFVKNLVDGEGQGEDLTSS